MDISKLMSLEGKVALVTGASKGLGRSFSIALAQAGADVVMTCRHPEDLIELTEEINQMGRKALAIRCDISDAQQISALACEVKQTLGYCDILVNNAGAMRCNKPPEDTTLGEWSFVNHTNIDGTFMLCREIAKQLMIPHGGGKIVNIASTAGLKVLKHFHAGSYEVSKAAVIQLTKVLAAEWAQYNINVNAIAPGYYDTQPNQSFFSDNPKLYKKVLSDIPLHRFGNTEELAGLLVCLCGDIANFMTGSTIVIDGGYCA